VPGNGGGRAPRPGLNTQDHAQHSESIVMVADGAEVVCLKAWLLAHGRWAAWQAQCSATVAASSIRPPCEGVCTCWGAPLGGQP
jgi:hypothetical protein